MDRYRRGRRAAPPAWRHPRRPDAELYGATVASWLAPALPYSTLILASLMIGAHSATSPAFFFASSSGVEPCASTPSGLYLSLISGFASIVTMSALIFLTMSGGVFAGA